MSCRFLQSRLNNTEPEVTITDGFRSLKLAHQILEKFEEGMNRIK